jgi:hypothetical protein
MFERHKSGPQLFQQSTNGRRWVVAFNLGGALLLGNKSPNPPRA